MKLKAVSLVRSLIPDRLKPPYAKIPMAQVVSLMTWMTALSLNLPVAI